jgi:preprotein translocase, SecE subunit, bacterial
MTEIKTKDKAPAAKRAEAKSAPEGPSRVEAFLSYFENARIELGKVSWPTRKEIKAALLAVLALVTVMAIFLGIADALLSRLVQLVLSMGV